MSKNTVYLLSGGVNYYLSGGAATQTAYSGSGTPWTAESTTPYELSLNEYTPSWVSQPAPAVTVFSGGPPFVPGKRPVYRSFDNIVENVGIQMKVSGTGNTAKDNAIALLRQLRQILNTSLYSVPCVLAVQSGSNTCYSEIYAADVPEAPTYIAEADGTWRATITWTRHPHFSLLSTGETLLNASSFQNRFSGSPDNTVAFSTGAGDLIFEGTPLNLALTLTSAGNLADHNYYFSSVQSVLNDATTQTVTTSSTTGASAASGDTITVGTTATANQRTRMRLFATTSSVTTNVEMRLLVYFSSNAQNLLYTGPWVRVATSVSLYDAGTIPTALFHDTGVTTIYVLLQGRSTNGSSSTVTLDNFYIAYYYTFCKVSGTATLDGSSAGVLRVRSFTETSNRATLPLLKSFTYTSISGAQANILRLDGSPPRYFSGATLLALIQNSTTFQFSSSLTFSITATHAPQWQSVRGSN